MAAQGGYGGDQFQDAGRGGYNQPQAGGSDQDAIKQQKIVPPPLLINFFLFALSCLGSCNHLHNPID